MANNLANALQGAHAAKAFAAGTTVDREAERAAARSDIEQSKQALELQQKTKPTETDYQTMAQAQSVELQNVLAKQQAQMREGNKARSYSGFERFDADGDLRHINVAFRDISATGSKLYGDIARVDKLSVEDKALMDQAGINPQLQQEILDNPEVNKSYAKITKKDGSTSFGDIDSLKGVTQYGDYANDKELTRQKTVREIEMLSAIGYDTTPRGREAFRRASADFPQDFTDYKSQEFQDAYTKYYKEQEGDSRLSRRGGAGENLTEKEAEAKRRVGMQGIYPGDADYDSAFSDAMTQVNTEWNRPSRTRNVENAEVARTALDEAGFWEKDFQNMSLQERSQIEPGIRRIEELGGAALSPEAEKQLVRIAELTSMGDMASDLTADQTGIIDNVLRTAKKYIFNDVEGIDSEAAYAAYRNVVKHALYGASLQPGESEAFKSQFGSLSQQQGPVLAQLRTSMEQLRSNYDSILQLNDPHVIAYRTGKTGAELEDVVNALDERLEMIDNIANDRPVSVGAVPIKNAGGDRRTFITPASQATMDRLNANKNTGGAQ